MYEAVGFPTEKKPAATNDLDLSEQILQNKVVKL